MKTAKPLIKDLAKELQYIVEKHTVECLWRHNKEHETLETLVSELKSLISNAKNSKEELQEHFLLSINQVESEGYLRAALTVENILKDLKLAK
jgi:hypothetical protein